MPLVNRCKNSFSVKCSLHVTLTYNYRTNEPFQNEVKKTNLKKKCFKYILQSTNYKATTTIRMCSFLFHITHTLLR